MELFYSLCCSELSCSPHRTPFTLYQWRPSSTVARATVRTPVSTRLPGKQDIWVWQWTLKCFDTYISYFISTHSFQKQQHSCSSWSNINFRMITKMGPIFIKRVIMFWYLHIFLHLSENSFQKQHFCSSCSNINFRMITKMGLTLIKKKTIIFWK